MSVSLWGRLMFRKAGSGLSWKLADGKRPRSAFRALSRLFLSYPGCAEGAVRWHGVHLWGFCSRGYAG